MPEADDPRLLGYRSEFPGLEQHTHLISHSLGAMPRGARADLQRYAAEWQGDSIAAWTEHWLPAMDALGDTIASVLGAPPGSVALSQNVSTVQAMVASCFDFAPPRRRVVYTSLNFPSVDYIWQEQQRRGAEVVVVPSSDGVHPPTEALLEAIDERTLIVPISHVLFRSSGMQDVQAVVQRAHAVGALVLLDVYQSAGSVPLALAEWDVDLACGGSVKWACGGPGVGYLYAKPEVLPRLRPTATGWFAHARPFAFEPAPIELAEGRWRLMTGTPAVPAIYAARAGWQLLAEIGVEAIRAKSLRQTRMLMDAVEARGLRLNTPRDDARRGGSVVFDFEGAEQASQALLARGFLHDHRPGAGLRVGPHFYNTDDEIAAFLAALDEVRG